MRISRRLQHSVRRMVWKPRPKGERWRAFATKEECAVVDEADKAKRRWEQLRDRRAAIINRALKRAAYYASRNGRDGNDARR